MRYSQVSSLDISTNLLDEERLKATGNKRVSVCLLSTINFKWIVQHYTLMCMSICFDQLFRKFGGLSGSDSTNDRDNVRAAVGGRAQYRVGCGHLKCLCALCASSIPLLDKPPAGSQFN